MPITLAIESGNILTIRVGYKHRQEQTEITESAMFELADHVKTIQRNSLEFRMDSMSVSNTNVYQLLIAQ